MPTKIDLDALLPPLAARTTWTFDGPERIDVPVSGRYAVNSHRLQLEAAERGLGIARVFERSAAPGLAAGRLVPVLPAWPSPPTRLQLVTPSPHHPAAAAAFAQIVQEVLGARPVAG